MSWPLGYDIPNIQTYSYYSMQMAESWITQCGSWLIYELLPGKAILYIIPITFIQGKLPANCACWRHWNHSLSILWCQIALPIVLTGTLPVLLLLQAVEMAAQSISWNLGPWVGCVMCKWKKCLVENIVHVLSIFKYCLICPNTV